MIVLRTRIIVSKRILPSTSRCTSRTTAKKIITSKSARQRWNSCFNSKNWMIIAQIKRKQLIVVLTDV
jgi:hypothetical protein